LYSCLIRDAGMMEMDCCSMSQHSTSASDLISVPVAALDASAFFARALRFPTGLLVSIIEYPLIGLVLTPDLDERENKALLTVCPRVESSLCLSACCGILGPSPVVFPTYRLYAVSKSCHVVLVIEGSLVRTSANCGIDASWMRGAIEFAG